MKTKALIALAGCALVILCGSQLLSSPKPSKRFPVDPAALYQADNELYFNNELPKNVEVVAAEAPDAEVTFQKEHAYDIAETEHTVGTHWYKMFISPTYNLTLTDERESVLHESCHIKEWEIYEKKGSSYGGGHGPEWQGCMLDLAKKGAFSDIW